MPLHAIVSRSPASNWAKGRLLMMIFSMILLLWSLGEVIDLSMNVNRNSPTEQSPSAAGVREGSLDDLHADGKQGDAVPLRNDLFLMPKPQRTAQAQEPKTNPAELLRLIELQGVLGGDHPKAIIMYKSTQEAVTVSAGDDLGEFKVMEVQERSVVLKWRDDLFELSL